MATALPGARSARGDHVDWGDSWIWLTIGLVGQAAFGLRFLVQWVASERQGESVVPVSFWYLSLVGSLILLAYAVHKREPVFILAYLPNAAVYLRNLVLIRRKQRLLRGEEKPDPPVAAEPTPSTPRH